VRRKLHLLEVLVGDDALLFNCENMQLLGINVFFQLLSQHKYRDNGGVTVTRTPILQTRQNWHNHLSSNATVRDIFLEWTVTSNVLLAFIYNLSRTA
jgi:hypothetical protein